MALGWTFTCTGAAALPLERELGVELSVVGLFTTAFLLGEALTSIPGGRLADRVGARRVGLWGAALMAAGSALASIAPEAALILVGRTLTGVGTGLAYVAVVAWLRGAGALAQGLVGGFALAGAGLAVALVPRLEDPLGWRAPFVPEIALAAVAGALATLAPRQVRAAARRRVPLRDLLARPLVWRYGAMASFSFGASFAVAAWIVPLFAQSDGFSAEAGAVAGSLILFGGILTRPLGGGLVRRWPGAARRIMCGSILAGAGAVLLLAVNLGAGGIDGGGAGGGPGRGAPVRGHHRRGDGRVPRRAGGGRGRDDRDVGLLRRRGGLPPGPRVRRRRGPARGRDPRRRAARAAPGGAPGAARGRGR